MSKKLLLIVLFGAFLLSGNTLVFGNSSAPTVYSYTGNNFDDVFGSYTTANSVSGSFTVASAFPADMPPTDISAQVLGYSFTDGINTFDESNSEICFFGIGLGTDSAGIPDMWVVMLCTPVAQVGDPVSILLTVSDNDGFGFIDAGQTTTCTAIENGTCTSTAVGDPTEGGLVEDLPGTWVRAEDPALGEANPIPALNSKTSMLVAILLGLTGLVSMRRRRVRGAK